MIRKYHNHKEPLNHHETPGRQIKQILSNRGGGAKMHYTVIKSSPRAAVVVVEVQEMFSSHGGLLRYQSQTKKGSFL